MMSYSKDFCERSHVMYTACNTHHEEGHSGDWRECAECNHLEEARPFQSTNRFTVTPCLEKFIPKGSMLTYGCGMEGCKTRMLPGHLTNSFSYLGGIRMCHKCSES